MGVGVVRWKETARETNRQIDRQTERDRPGVGGVESKGDGQMERERQRLMF